MACRLVKNVKPSIILAKVQVSEIKVPRGESR